MKYYSDKTKKMYAQVADLDEAEKAYDKAHAAEIAEKESAKKDADEIKKAYDELKVAKDKYVSLVNDFIKNHKNYRITLSDPDYFDSFDILSVFRKLFF